MRRTGLDPSLRLRTELYSQVGLAPNTGQVTRIGCETSAPATAQGHVLIIEVGSNAGVAMTNTSIRAFASLVAIMLSLCLSIGAAAPIHVDTKTLAVTVDPTACRWSAAVKGTPMQINDVYFLPGDDASGWTVTSAVNQNETNNLG